MNHLSWLIYAADVADNISGVASFVAVVGSLVALGTGVPSVFADDDLLSRSLWRIAKSAMIAVAVTLPLAVLVPSKKAMLMIAASEIGERALSTQQIPEISSKALKVLDKYLDEQLTPAKK